MGCRPPLAVFFALVFCWSPISAREPAKLRVDIDFPGGSGRVESIDQQARSIQIKPSSHKGRGWECWWFVRIRGLSDGEQFELTVGDAPWATPDRAAFSADRRTWRQTSAGVREGSRIRYRMRAEGPDLWCAWGPPFTDQDARRLVAEVAGRKSVVSALELCKSRNGRAVPALHFSTPKGSPKPANVVWIQARQHAWESGSSWVARGLIEFAASDDLRAKRLRQRAELLVTPIMDIDNVAIGAGGKNEEPRDHNRDWSAQPHWTAVAAAQKRIREFNEGGRLALFIDLHNPGASSKRPYYYITPRKLLSRKGRRNLDRFLACSREEITDPLPFFGETHESGPNYDSQWKSIAKNWVSLNCREHVVSVTLETAWNTPHSTTAGYTAVGRQLGLAIERYLRMDARK